MNTKITSLVAGMALIVGMGAANAEELMRLSTTQMDSVTAGTGDPSPFYDFEKFTIVIDVHDDKDVMTNIDLDGNSSVAKANASASCTFTYCETTAQGLTFTRTLDGLSSTATSVSISATDSLHFGPYNSP